MADYIVSDAYETIGRISEPNSIQLYPMTFKKVANYFRLALLNSKLERMKKISSQITVSAGINDKTRNKFLDSYFKKMSKKIAKLESKIKFFETGEETTFKDINCRMLKLQENMMEGMRYNMKGIYEIPSEKRQELFGIGIHEQARINIYEQARQEEEKRLMDLINASKQKESSEEKTNSNQFTMTEKEMNQVKGQVENKFEEAEKKNEETPTYGINDEIFNNAENENTENVEEKVEKQPEEKVEEVPAPVETPNEKVSEEDKKEVAEPEKTEAPEEKKEEVETEKTETHEDKNIRENIIVIPERKPNYEEKLVEQYKQLGEQSKDDEVKEEMREEIQKTAEMAEKTQREEKRSSNALEKILNTDFTTISDEDLEKMFDIKEVYEAVRMVSNKRDILKAEEVKIDEARPIVDEIKTEVMDINKETVDLYRKFGDSLEEDCNRKERIEINDLDAASTADDTIKMINEMLGEINTLDGSETNNKEVKK